MKKRLIILTIFFVIVEFFPSRVFAGYVLPYPSYMPGNKLYSLSRVLDLIRGYWYWGNIGQFKHHLSLADKYLVEAKTLFEYKQYLLAIDALDRSDEQFSKLPQLINAVSQNHKSDMQIRQNYEEAREEHILVLNQLLVLLPNQFNWQPEKKNLQQLKIKDTLENSIKIRSIIIR